MRGGGRGPRRQPREGGGTQTMNLAGKVVLVTGASSGIGAAVARAAAAAGAALLLSGRSRDRGAGVARDIAAAGGRAEFLAGDLTDPAFADRLVEAAADRFGRLDVLVNNAGIIHRATVDRTTDAQWHETMAVNLHAVFYLSRAAVRRMQRQGGGGAIVNVASDWGLVGGRDALAYCASKGAVVQMTRAMALDHAEENIRVNAVCPASVDTPMLRWSADLFKGDKSVEETLEDWGKMHPVGRVARPEEVAEVIVFLAGPRASFVTGGDYKVDGGMLAALGVRLPD